MTRSLTAARSARGAFGTSTPSSADRLTSCNRSDVAIRVLLGTQSVRTVDPPSPSRSTKVTSAPSLRATSAASYPPGPPPMITTWVMVRLSRIAGSVPLGVLGSRPPAFYRYRIYEHEVVDGVLRRTGRWVVVQIVIDWGDGKPNRGWLVTAYPVQTHNG